MKDALFDRLIGEIYRCPGDALAWSRLAVDIASAYKAEHVHFVLFNADGSVATEAASDPEAGREYALDYASRDIAVPRVMACSAGRAIWSHELLSAEELARCPVQNELLPRVGIGSRTWVHTPFGNDGMLTTGILHARRQGKLDRLQSNRLERLHRHLQQAMHLHLTLEAARERQRSFEVGLNALRTGVVLLDRAGRVLFANRAAWSVAGGAIKITNRLAAVPPASDARLQRLIVTAIGRLGVAAGGAMTLARCRVTVVPIQEPGQALEARVAAVVLINSTTVASDPTPLVEAGLTSAEAALALALTEGETLEAYAVRTGRTIGTVRAQLRAVFSKTDTHRQSELLLYVLGISRSDGQV